MTRLRVLRLEPKGWDLVADVEAVISTAFAVAEHASRGPAPARTRVEDAVNGRVIAVFECGQCVELNGKAFP